jgi:hypothetical protein
MTDTDRSLCDCPEPCACYAEGYVAGSGTESRLRNGDRKQDRVS